MSDITYTIHDQIPAELRQEVEHSKQLAFSGHHNFRSETEIQVHDDKFCSDADRFKYLMALTNGQVVAGLWLYKRTIKLQGKHCLLGGVGGVWTGPEHRHQGIATHLLSMGLEVLRDESCGFAFLCTDVTNPHRLKLYHDAGFHLLEHAYTFQGKSGQRYEDIDGMLAPLIDPEMSSLILEGQVKLDLGMGNW